MGKSGLIRYFWKVENEGSNPSALIDNLEAQMKALVEDLFGRFQFIRRLSRGRWEQWYIDYPICSAVWIKIREKTNERPILSRGNVLNIEYWW